MVIFRCQTNVLSCLVTSYSQSFAEGQNYDSRSLNCFLEPINQLLLRARCFLSRDYFSYKCSFNALSTQNGSVLMVNNSFCRSPPQPPVFFGFPGLFFATTSSMDASSLCNVPRAKTISSFWFGVPHQRPRCQSLRE